MVHEFHRDAARKVRFGGTPKPARETRALPGHRHAQLIDMGKLPMLFSKMNTSRNHPPALWEIEHRLFNIVVEQQGLPLARLRPESRLIEDLHIDSLDLVELIMAIEEEFAVSIPDDAHRLPFITGSVTLRELSRIVAHHWGSGRPERKSWWGAREPAPPNRHAIPFTQLGGTLEGPPNCSGSLHETMLPNEQGFAQFRRLTDGMRCVLIPAAEVEIGSSAPDALPDQLPTHRVAMPSFLIDAEPVSVSAFARFLNSTAPTEVVRAEWCGVATDDRRGRHFQLQSKRGCWEPKPDTQHQPMVLVSWFGAQAYALWANGGDWRGDFANGDVSFLPTEAQWEYAARGALWRKFPWGNEPCTSAHALVARHTARARYDGLLPLADVHATLGVSPFGLLHMAGNVWNWCADSYSANACARPDSIPLPSPDIRAKRGGSWIGPAELAASSYRRGRPSHARGRCLGFRCAGLAPG